MCMMMCKDNNKELIKKKLGTQKQHIMFLTVILSKYCNELATIKQNFIYVFFVGGKIQGCLTLYI